MKTYVHSLSYRVQFFSELESCSENKKTLFMVLLYENRPLCEIMWTSIVEPGRPHMTV
jgi:hypothetical protein